MCYLCKKLQNTHKCKNTNQPVQILFFFLILFFCSCCFHFKLSSINKTNSYTMALPFRFYRINRKFGILQRETERYIKTNVRALQRRKTFKWKTTCFVQAENQFYVLHIQIHKHMHQVLNFWFTNIEQGICDIV